MTPAPGRFIHTTAAVAALLLAIATGAARADEPDASSAASAAATTVAPPAYHLFTSWFGGKAKTEPPVTTNDADVLPPVATGASTGATSFTARAGALVSDALDLIGINYRMGGNSPASGFDCSGMVRYVYRSALGLSLPRRAEEISRVGVKVALDELKPGDLVFYRTLKKTFSHVGIYLGNNRFIHAPSAGGAVRIDDMTQGYWTARFDGARRIDG